MTQLASQEHIDRLREAGREIIETFRALVDDTYPGSMDDVDRQRSVGRELGMALFLAGLGDELITRVLLVNGLGLAVGECAAQQGSADAAQGLIDALWEGVTGGMDFVNQGFARAGQA